MRAAVLVAAVAILCACSGGSGSSEQRAVDTGSVAAEGSAGATCQGGGSPTLVGLDPATGTLRWVHCPAEPSVYAVIGLEGEVVHAVAQRPGGGPEPQFEYLALDAGDGSPRWQRTVTARFSGEPRGLVTGAPGPVGGGEVTVLLIGDPASGTIVALDAPSGEERWSRPADGMVTLAHTSDLVALADQFTPSATGALLPQRVLALDRRTGNERWGVEVDGLNWPTAVAGGVLVVDLAGRAVGIDLADGREQWRSGEWHEGARSVGVGSAVVAEPSRPEQRGVVGYDPATGEQRWEIPAHTFNSIWAVDDDSVYLHHLERGQLVAVAADDGTERWYADHPGRLYAAGGGWVLVAGDQPDGRGDLSGLSAGDGRVTWTIPLPIVAPGYATSAVVDDDLAVVALSNLAPGD